MEGSPSSLEPPVSLGDGRTLFSFSSYHENDHQGCQDHLQSKPRSPICTHLLQAAA